MNTDFRVKTNFFTHHKTLKLIKKLGKPGAFSLIALWSYAAQNAINGDISDLDAESLAAVTFWEGDPQAFLEALIETGFIDEIKEGNKISRSIHNWERHNAYAANAERRSENARMQAAKRWEKKFETIDNKGFDANSNANSNAPSPDPSPNPSPNPSPSPNPNPKEYMANSSEFAHSNGKKVFLEHVLLTEEEYRKLEEVFPDKHKQYIQALNDYIALIGKQKAAKKYKSHYHTILNWHRREQAEIERRLHVATAMKEKEEEKYKW